MLNAKSNENANSEASPAHTPCKGIHFGKVIKLRLFKSGENYVKMSLLAWFFIKAVLPQRLIFFQSLCALFPWSTSERDHKKNLNSKCSQMFWENTNTSMSNLIFVTLILTI